MAINVFSEVNNLKKVLLHKPGEELLNLTPNVLEELLFDDIPAFYEAREEHDQFAQIFKGEGVEVVYLSDLAAEVLNLSDEIRQKFIDEFLEESGIEEIYKDIVIEYFKDLDSKNLILKTMSGITMHDLAINKFDIEDTQDHIIHPMPNLYFTRDSFASIGNGVSINHMFSETRNRETIYGHYIFKYHPEYKETKKLSNRFDDYSIEGGDILIINEETILIGNSQRTDQKAIESVSKTILKDSSSFNTILEIIIDDRRAFMHLDTVLTQIDHDAFIVHPEILENLEIREIILENDEIVTRVLDMDLATCLAKYMNVDEIKLFKCGGDDIIASQREQWTDGANVVTIAPGKFIAYKRNFVTNEILKDAGYTVLELDASNLTMGRGGPRCMSMPLIRE